LGWNVKSFSKSHSSFLRQAGGWGGENGYRDWLLFSSVEVGRSGLLAWQINLAAQVEVHSLGKCFPLLHAPHRIFNVAACQCGFLLHHWSHMLLMQTTLKEGCNGRHMEGS